MKNMIKFHDLGKVGFIYKIKDTRDPDREYPIIFFQSLNYNLINHFGSVALETKVLEDIDVSQKNGYMNFNDRVIKFPKYSSIMNDLKEKYGSLQYDDTLEEIPYWNEEELPKLIDNFTKCLKKSLLQSAKSNLEELEAEARQKVIRDREDK